MKALIPFHLSDVQLAAEVARLACCERKATALLVAHLAEFDARRLYLGAGFSSLFVCCCEVLHLSEHETYNRIEVARAARAFPRILDLLTDGALKLTTVRLLAPHLTAENSEHLLAEASFRSKRQVEELVARLFPIPAAPASIRKVPVPRETATNISPAGPPRIAPLSDREDAVGATAAPPTSLSLSAAPLLQVQPHHRAHVAPLAPDLYAIRFTASAKTHEKLRLAQDLLRHTVPSGDTAEIFDRALTALLEDLARKKLAATARPRRSRPAPAGSRHIPAAVKRAVWLRDRGCCAFAAKGGRRCTERGFLEFHHVDPDGVGGEATVDNIELRCRAHNVYEAELFYGPRKSGEAAIREACAAYRVPSPDTTRSGTSRATDQVTVRFRALERMILAGTAGP